MHGRKIAACLSAFLLIVVLAVPTAASSQKSVSFFLTEAEKSIFSEDKILRVLTLPAWHPYCYEGTGTAMDVLGRLCEAADVTLQPIEAKDYDDALRRLEQGEADLTAVKIGIYGQETDMVPYLRAPVQMVTHKEAQLNEASKIVIAQFSGAEFLNVDKYPQIKQISFDTVEDCLYAVRSRQTDFFACDLYMLSAYAKRFGSMDLMMTSIPQHDVQIGFGLPENADERLISMLRKAVDSFSTAELSESLLAHEAWVESQNGFIDFVYRNPFELLCALASLFFVVVIVLLIYTRTRVRQHEELRGYEDSYRMLADTFGEAGMEYDFLQDRLVLFGEHHERLDLPAHVDELHNRLKEKTLRISFTEEDFNGLLANNAPGRSYEVEFQCGVREGGWKWFRMIYIVVCTSESHRRPIRLIGCLVDNDEQHLEKERLLKKGSNDSLTGLLNRNAAEEQITALLHKPIVPSLLLILDVDKFKRFNDTHGHLCGDAALCVVAEALRDVFGDEAVTCRWGGDEFLVFLPGAGERADDAVMRIERLREIMKTFVFQNEPLPMNLSIGGSVTAPDSSFTDLFQQADEALYAAKKNGRDQFALRTFE